MPALCCELWLHHHRGMLSLHVYAFVASCEGQQATQTGRWRSGKAAVERDAWTRKDVSQISASSHQSASYLRRGRCTANTASVSSERASMSPPCALAISRAMYSPSPRLLPASCPLS